VQRPVGLQEAAVAAAANSPGFGASGGTTLAVHAAVYFVAAAWASGLLASTFVALAAYGGALIAAPRILRAAGIQN